MVFYRIFNTVFKDHDIKLPLVVAWIGDLVSLIDGSGFVNVELMTWFHKCYLR